MMGAQLVLAKRRAKGRTPSARGAHRDKQEQTRRESLQSLGAMADERAEGLRKFL
jgi:hypothetical protein